MTKNISLVLAPQITKAAFRCLQFLPLDSHRVIAVIMTDAGFVDALINAGLIRTQSAAALQQQLHPVVTLHQCW